jgi:hypothetical protein
MMLTYDDCVGLCGLTPEEIEAIAKHEHLPEIVALEMGSCLCGTPEGEQAVRRMILDDIEEASGRGDTLTAAKLRLVLIHFDKAHLVQPSPGQLDQHAGGGEDGGSTLPAERFDDEADYAMCALGLDITTAPWMRARVDSYLTAMLRHFRLDYMQVQERFSPEMRAARTRCAACVETARCRRFLAGVAGSEPSSAFCPNANLFRKLRQCSSRPRRTRAAK